MADSEYIVIANEKTLEAFVADYFPRQVLPRLHGVLSKRSPQVQLFQLANLLQRLDNMEPSNDQG